MSISESRGSDLHRTVRSEETHGSNPIVRLDTSPIEFLSTVLSRTFHNEPHFTYIMPDEQVRRMVLPWFVRSVAIRATQICGEIYTTENLDGGALWIGPGRALKYGQMLRTGIAAMPFKLGRASFKRCMKLVTRLDAVHQLLVSKPHWYLMALGVEPSTASMTISGALIEPVLSRADSDGLPCYLETFQEKDLPFYEERGFRVEGAGHIPGGGPVFWTMLRPTPPQTFRKHFVQNFAK